MEILFYLFAAAVLIYIFRRHIAMNRRSGAAFNVLIAKYTFGQLSQVDQTKVETRVSEIMNTAMAGLFTGFNGEVDKYGWYALAMNELGIPPAVQYPGWNKVRNPFTAILPGDPLLDGTACYINKKFDIDVSVGPAHNLVDNLSV